MAVKTYQVSAQRIKRGWILSVPEVPGAVSQVRSLAQAEAHAREAVSAVLEVEPASFELELKPQINQHLLSRIEEVREATEHAEQLQRDAAAESRAVVKALAADEGLSGGDISALLHVSGQRISQLLNSGT